MVNLISQYVDRFSKQPVKEADDSRYSFGYHKAHPPHALTDEHDFPARK